MLVFCFFLPISTKNTTFAGYLLVELFAAPYKLSALGYVNTNPDANS